MYISVKIAMAREMCGIASVRHIRPSSCYGKMSPLSKALGHLSAVYCVLFDRTGDFIITVSIQHVVTGKLNVNFLIGFMN